MSKTGSGWQGFLSGVRWLFLLLMLLVPALTRAQTGVTRPEVYRPGAGATVREYRFSNGETIAYRDVAGMAVLEGDIIIGTVGEAEAHFRAYDQRLVSGTRTAPPPPTPLNPRWQASEDLELEQQLAPRLTGATPSTRALVAPRGSRRISALPDPPKASGAADCLGTQCESKVPVRLWEGGVVSYRIASGFSTGMLKRIRAAIRHWVERTPLTFIARNQPDTVVIQPSDPEKGGCAANVGRFQNGAGIYLEEGCDLGAIIHEIGHATGLWHEQSRCDRDSYVTVLTANIEVDKEHNFAKHCDDGADLGPYDYGSIMHYGAYAFAKGNAPTIVAANGAQLGQRDGLSPNDVDYGVLVRYGATAGLMCASAVDDGCQNYSFPMDRQPMVSSWRTQGASLLRARVGTDGEALRLTLIGPSGPVAAVATSNRWAGLEAQLEANTDYELRMEPSGSGNVGSADLFMWFTGP